MYFNHVLDMFHNHKTHFHGILDTKIDKIHMDINHQYDKSQDHFLCPSTVHKVLHLFDTLVFFYFGKNHSTRN